MAKANRERRARKKRLNLQEKAANTRAKYGPALKPAPVVVRALETGEVITVVDQSKCARRRQTTGRPR